MAVLTTITPAPKRRKVSASIEVRADGTRELLIDGRPLMGLAEVADALDVRVQNVDHVPGVPEPVSKIRATRLWLGSEIEVFAAWRQARKAAQGR
jgi:hypothetical protein